MATIAYIYICSYIYIHTHAHTHTHIFCLFISARALTFDLPSALTRTMAFSKDFLVRMSEGFRFLSNIASRRLQWWEEGPGGHLAFRSLHHLPFLALLHALGCSLALRSPQQCWLLQGQMFIACLRIRGQCFSGDVAGEELE